MGWTIHSIGDSAFLEQILIAVSMVTKNNSFLAVVAIGLMVSLMMVFVTSMLNGGGSLDMRQVVVGFVLFQLIFVPTTTVTIENAYTGQTSVVENVPLGIGAVGGLISGVGYGLTRIFDTAFSPLTAGAGITRSNFAESLSLLNDVRRQMHNPAILAALDKAGGDNFDFRGSWYNYIRECTLTKIDTNKVSLTQLLNQPIEAALYSPSEISTTLVRLGSQGRTMTCKDAFSALRERSKITDQEVAKAITRTLGFAGDQTSAFRNVNTALAALGASSTAARDFAKVSLLEPIYREAVAGRYQDWQDFSSALMVNQAIQHRNTKWAAEQSVFLSIARPMLAFFEGFIYAITPIMAFMMVFGGVGIGLIGKYVQTLFWTQLWMPIISITNMYIHSAASNSLSHLVASDAGLTSMYALDKAGDIMQNWIAIGGVLVAATPAISFFVVSGSTYAFSGLANRISSAEGIDTKVSAPDVVRPAAMFQQNPSYTHSAIGGTVASGGESLVPSFNMSGALSQNLSNTRTQLQQHSSSFQEHISRGVQDGVSQEKAYARFADMGQTFSAQQTDATRFVQEQAKNFSKQFSVSDQHSDAVRGAIGGAVSGAISASTAGGFLRCLVGKSSSEAPATSSAFENSAATTGSVDNGKSSSKKIPPYAAGLHRGAKLKQVLGGKKPSIAEASLSLGGTGRTESVATDSASQTSSDVSRFVTGLRHGEEHSQSLSGSLAHRFSERSSDGAKRVWGETLSKHLSKSANEVVSLSQSESDMRGLQNSLGSSTNTDLRTLSAAIVADPKAEQFLHNHFGRQATPEMRKDANDIAARYQNLLGMDPKIAATAGKITTLCDTGGISHQQASQNLHGVGDAFRMAIGGQDVPSQPSHLPLGTGVLAKRVEQQIGNGPETRDFLAIQNKAQTAVPADNQLIQQRGLENAKNLSHQNTQMTANFSQQHVKKAQQHMLSSLPTKSFSASGWGAVANSTQWISRHARQLGGEEAALTDFKQEKFTMAQNRYALTPAQAGVFAESFDTDRTRMASAVRDLKIETAKNSHPAGHVTFDKNNQPILSESDDKFAAKMANVLQNASTAGDAAGSYLTAVGGYNIATKKLDG